MSQFKHISVDQLASEITEKDYVIVDIRDANAFAQGHIPGAVHLTNDNLPNFMRDADFDQPTIVCCYHGVSSQPAAELLIGQDFTDVYSLDGGFVQWQANCPHLIEQ